MKKLLLMGLIAGSIVSCSKKASDTPQPNANQDNVIEYTFKADSAGSYVYVMNYYDYNNKGSYNGSTTEQVRTNTWTHKVTLPAGTPATSIYYNVGQNPPYLGKNIGVISIKLNGNVVATDSKQFTSTSTLAGTSYYFDPK